eukprot:scaffold46924_cov54-Attheya_sp.AAC.1
MLTSKANPASFVSCSIQGGGWVITRLLRAPQHGHTGHTGTHPPTPRTHRVPQQRRETRDARDLGLARKRGDVRRETRGTCGWVLSLVLSPVRQLAYQPPSLTYTFVGNKYNQFGNNK